MVADADDNCQTLPGNGSDTPGSPRPSSYASSLTVAILCCCIVLVAPPYPDILSLTETSVLSAPEPVQDVTSTKAAPGSALPDLAPKVIFINGPHWMHAPGALPGCPVTCTITKNRSLSSLADAIVWNARWMTPFKLPPKEKPPGQRWLFNFNFEAPIYEQSRVANSVVRHLAPRIDWTMTFSADSDFFAPLQRFVPLAAAQARTRAAAGLVDYAAGRRKLLLWFVSNCNAPRLNLFKKLQALLPPGTADVFGSCGKRDPCPRKGPSNCTANLFKQYRFYAAFENSRCQGYITEKLFRAFDGGMVPLALGGRDVRDYEALFAGAAAAPAAALRAARRSLVFVDDFASPERLAAHLRRLLRDDAAYNLYHWWRRSARPAGVREEAAIEYCQLCQELHTGPGLQRPTRAFGDLGRWFYEGSGEGGGPRCLRNGPHFGEGLAHGAPGWDQSGGAGAAAGGEVVP